MLRRTSRTERQAQTRESRDCGIQGRRVVAFHDRVTIARALLPAIWDTCEMLAFLPRGVSGALLASARG